MPKGKKISERIKKKVIKFCQAGLDQNEIANELLISQSSVSKIIRECEKRRKYGNYNYSGRTFRSRSLGRRL